MKTLTITMLTAAASALLITAASAAPLSAGSSDVAASVAADSNIQNVRMVCNEEGRCWRERGERRVIIREGRDYAPRDRYIERRSYEDRGGVGIRAPGVSVGIGGDRY
jgi:predicted secreted protein